MYGEIGCVVNEYLALSSSTQIVTFRCRLLIRQWFRMCLVQCWKI